MSLKLNGQTIHDPWCLCDFCLDDLTKDRTYYIEEEDKK